MTHDGEDLRDDGWKGGESVADRVQEAGHEEEEALPKGVGRLLVFVFVCACVRKSLRVCMSVRASEYREVYSCIRACVCTVFVPNLFSALSDEFKSFSFESESICISYISGLAVTFSTVSFKTDWRYTVAVNFIKLRGGVDEK